MNCDQCMYGELCGQRWCMNGAVGVACRSRVPRGDISRELKEMLDSTPILSEADIDELGHAVMLCELEDSLNGDDREVR